MAIQCFSHLGVCVSDLARAERFYVEALGFDREGGLRVSGDPTDRLLGLDGTDLEAVYLRREGVRIELLHYHAPGHVDGDAPRPMNRLGLTHLSLRVDDLDGALEGCRAAGGSVDEATRIEIPAAGSRAVFVADPDGTRIELVQSPGDPTRPPMAAAEPRS